MQQLPKLTPKYFCAKYSFFWVETRLVQVPIDEKNFSRKKLAQSAPQNAVQISRVSIFSQHFISTHENLRQNTLTTSLGGFRSILCIPSHSITEKCKRGKFEQHFAARTVPISFGRKMFSSIGTYTNLVSTQKKKIWRKNIWG